MAVTEAECAGLGGVYAGDNEPCAGNCQCAYDITGDDAMSVADFNAIAGHFGQGNPGCVTRAQGDLNCDGIVNLTDFNLFAGEYGCGN